MIDCLNSLGHNTIISRHNKNNNICHLCTPCPHSSKCFMARCIKKSDFSVTIHSNLVSSNMLSNTTRLTSNNFAVSNMIEQRGLAMINMSHDCNNRGTCL